MEWIQGPPSNVDPELFDLSDVSVCMATAYSGPDSLNISEIQRWNILVDIRETCPCTGRTLPETTLHVFKVKGS